MRATNEYFNYTCPLCGVEMQIASRAPLEADARYEILKLKCMECDFRMPKLTEFLGEIGGRCTRTEK